MNKRYRRDRQFMRWAEKYPRRAFMVYVALFVVAILLGAAGNYVHAERSVPQRSAHGIV